MLLLHQGDAEDVYDDNDGDLAVVELDDQHHQHDIHHEPMMRFSPGLALGDYVGLIGSVNGLICLEDSYDDSAYYKIVRFYKGRFPSTEYDLGSEVYTLGTGMWRDLGHVPFHLNEHDRGHYVSGRLHWLAGELICAFDLDRELFRPMEAPPQAPGNTDHFSILGVRNHFRNLGVLKGCLCICDITLYSELSIWVKRDYGVEDSWSKKLISLSPSRALSLSLPTYLSPSGLVIIVLQ
ncbi:F-box protein At3g07870-like [Apium graveolens]|uniref:F-box protein At3g07870-like n=1 Tax=Apium graveolens TaxID=4045 RepID=UPI003D792A82